MKIEIHSKPTQEEYKTLERGKRGFVHPCLASIEQYDCEIIYNIPYKFFIVNYAHDVQGKYIKTLLTANVTDIVEILSKDGC
jgi:hypothetical protein